MQKFLIIFIILIFAGLSFALNTQAVDCDIDGNPCSSADCLTCLSVTLGWASLEQIDVDEFRSDCTLSSVNYTIEIINLETRDAGTSTSYTWTDLTESTTYEWKVKCDYQCTDASYSGSVYTDVYSFTTTSCNQSPTADSLSSGMGCIWPLVRLYFTYNDADGITDDPMTAYEIQIDDDNDETNGNLLSVTEMSRLEEGSSTATSFNYALPISENLPVKTLYYWRVKVQDTQGGWSNWTAGNFDLNPM